MKILLVGDDGIDVYRFGSANRISPEAPVPVFVPLSEKKTPGMAGNVRENLQALNCEVTYLHSKTSVKTRLIDMNSRQHLLRIDEDRSSDPVDVGLVDLQNFDAIVISDYNKGTVNYDTIKYMRRHFSGPIFVDTKKTDLAQLEGCWVKINRIEYEQLKTECTGLIVTLGADGARYKGNIYSTFTIDVIDACGAGDTFLAALVVEYLNTGKMDLAIQFAIRASAVTIQHVGVYAPTREEIDAITR